MPRSFTSSGPGYLAYVPGGGLYPAALADLVAGVVNRYTGVRLAAPALVQLESTRSTWLREVCVTELAEEAAAVLATASV